MGDLVECPYSALGGWTYHGDRDGHLTYPNVMAGHPGRMPTVEYRVLTQLELGA